MNDEPRPACPVCHKPDPAGTSWAVCDTPRGNADASCLATVDGLLGDLLDLVALANAPAALYPTTTGSAAMGGPRREPPLPLDIGVLDLAVGESVLAVLEQWERWWREHFGLTPYGVASAAYAARTRQNGPSSDSGPGRASGHPCPNLSGTVAFLRAWWPRVAEVAEPPPDEFAAEVTALHRRAEHALHIAADPGWTIACPTDGCHARLRVTHDGREALVRCERCRVSRTLHQLLVLARDEGRPCWVDADTAARHLGITVQHLGPLARDGRIRTRGAGDFRQFDINSLRHADADAG